MPELTLGKSQQALISYASPERVSYGMPDGVATGIATVAITADSAKVTSSVNIVDVYPNLFAPGAAGLTATLQTASNQAMLSIYGSGLQLCQVRRQFSRTRSLRPDRPAGPGRYGSRGCGSQGKRQSLEPGQRDVLRKYVGRALAKL